MTHRAGPHMPLSSRAAIGDGRGGFVIAATRVRAPQAGEVRVRLRAAGLCHTDLASLHWPGPLVLGHEGAGEVESVGAGVAGLVPGQRVLLNWAIPCGRCPPCARGVGALCERTQGVDPSLGRSEVEPPAGDWQGVPLQRSFRLGTLAEVTLVRAEALTVLPAALPMHCACVLGCGVMTGVGSVVNAARVQPGETVAVLGCGGVGLSVIQGARLAGARLIVAIDRHPQALERARRFGATHVLAADAPDALVTAVHGLTEGRGVDHAFEATGVPALAFVPLRLVRHGGTALQVSGATGDAQVALTDFWWDKRYLVPLYGNCLPERDFPRLFRWIERGELDIEGLVSRRYRLDELQEAFDDLRAGRLAKGVVEFDPATD